MNFLDRLVDSFTKHSDKQALCIDSKFYTYKELMDCVLHIRYIINNKINEENKLIGLIANDDLETYATIFALWFEGKAYIPINPDAPVKRNNEILKKIDCVTVFDSSKNSDYINNYKIINIKSHEPSETLGKIKAFNYYQNNIAYILFTSGSTGTPKGIPIRFYNLNALLTALYNDKEYKINSSDKCLQMYDLTFDASLTAFMPAILAGACVYTVPPKSIKYFQIFKLLKQYDLTVLKMVPSIIYYLRPYFNEIDAKSVRYCVFGGGKLYDNILREWTKCIPNSTIYNHYGPTECTVCSTYYTFNPNEYKTHAGVLSVGKPLDGFDFLIVDEENNEQPKGNHGELCLAGNQVTTGYWKNNELNAKAFFNAKDNLGQIKRFYKTGDICYIDNNGDLMYVERKDFQVKIRGFRVELGEIEHQIKAFIKDRNISVIDVNNNNGNNELALVMEGKNIDTNVIIEFLQDKLPNYMIPSQFHFVDKLPHNTNGKLDRKQLRLLISK
ncbi:AMP-binding protein [Hyunsoonleella ulvae]|uniref:AMP-binding protein n=1 Tax=Hyunsoonleella ulvae TaxID=2799948 RepID=UPI00193AA78B|nr:AMP-binding protein [Hyunsoonleella ulvae]